MKRSTRQAVVLSSISLAASSAALGQISASWTGLGSTASFNDPYNWSSFPNLPGAGGVVTGGNPFRSEALFFNENVTLSRWENSGSLAFGARAGTGSITLVGEAVVATNLGPVIPLTRFAYTDGLATPIHGQNGLTKTGSGIFALSGVNSYTGGTRVINGWLVPTRPEALGASGGSVTLDGGGLAVAVDLSGRHIVVAANGGTIVAQVGSAAGTLGSVSGAGNLRFQSGNLIGPFVQSIVVGDVGHIGSTIIDARVVLGSSGSATFGRLSATPDITIRGQLAVGTTTLQSPADLINDAAAVSLRGGRLTFTNQVQPEQFGPMSIAEGRSFVDGRFVAQSLTRLAGGVLSIGSASEPYVATSPGLVGSGAVGTPEVGVLPYAVSATISSVRAVTFDQGRLRPLGENEWIDSGSLQSPDSPQLNVTTAGSAIPLSVKALRVVSASGPTSATITVNGGGVYCSGNGALTNRLEFLDREGFIHGPAGGIGATRGLLFGAISGTEGLTVSGNISLRGASTYTGPTHLMGHVEVSNFGPAGSPGPLGMSVEPVVIYGDSDQGSSLTIRSTGLDPAPFDRDLSIVSSGYQPNTIQFTSELSFIPLLKFNSDVETSGVVTFISNSINSTVEINGAISGDGLVQLKTSGPAIIRGNNTYTGGTSVTGPVAIGSDTAFGTGTVWVQSPISGGSVSLSADGGPRVIANRLTWPGDGGPLGTLNFHGSNPLTFTSAVAPLGSATINLSAAAPLTFAGGFINHRLTTAGTGTLNLAWYRGRGIDAHGGRVTFLPGSHATSSRLESLTIAAAATVDLNDHTLVIQAGGGSFGGAAGVRSLLAAGRLISSMAQAEPSFAVGYGTAGDVLGLGPTDPPAVFFDQLVRDHDVLVRYTLAGDADLNGLVNLDDFTRLAGGFGSAAALWPQGDFDYDGAVTLDDFTRLAANFGQTASRAVPEPSAAILLALAAFASAARRRRSTGWY